MCRRGKNLLMLAIACAPFYFTLPVQEIQHIPIGEQYNTTSSKELVKWINNNISSVEAILSDMPTSSIIRACTSNPIVMNPQYESEQLRSKVMSKKFKEIKKIVRQGFFIHWVIV